jgi:uncharacterized protein YggE
MSDLKSVGAVIDAASRAGANSVDRVAFVLRQTSPARGQALADATQQAMNKARSIAQALDGQVFRVVEEQEGASASADFHGDADMTVAIPRESRAPVTPVQAGQLTISSDVQLIVEIET